MRTDLYHPKCGQYYADSPRTGHCSGCCRTFSGETAFDKHQRLDPDGRTICLDPATITVGRPWWVDETGRWHYGERPTAADREKLNWKS